MCVHTNIIVLSAPICSENSNKCDNFNYKLGNLVRRLSNFSPNKMVFLDSCNILGLRQSNIKISRDITSAVNCPLNKNLIYINLEEKRCDGDQSDALAVCDGSVDLSVSACCDSSINKSLSINNKDPKVSVTSYVNTVPNTSGSNSSITNFYQNQADLYTT